MKKAISFFLSLIILISTVGITVASGYCQMKFNKSCEVKSCCNKCSDSCCKTEIKVYKLNYETLLSSKIKVDVFVVGFLPITSFDFIHFHSGFFTENNFLLKVPPLITALNSRPFLQTFLI